MLSASAYYLWPVLLLISSPLLEGCGVKYVSGGVSPNFQDYSIKKIAVLPFQPQQISADNIIPEARPVAEGSEDLLTRLFVERLRATARYQVIAQDLTESAFKKAQTGESGTITTRLAQKVAQSLGADAVIIGRVQKYVERMGGAVGSERPASVGFIVTLISARDGQTLWSSEYYETQKTLSEDVNTLSLFIKRGGKWLTARELAEYGMEEMIKTLPKKKG